MKISCIIPTCDRTEYLLETLESVLKQTEQPHEIIVVNNGKKPIVLSQNLKNKIRVYDIIPYVGVAQARNFGASIASGDFLAFLDDDDLWNPDYLKNVKEAMRNDPADFLISRLDRLYQNKIKTKHSFDNIEIGNILIANPGITGSNLVAARDAFFKLRGFDPKLPPSEDKSLILEAILGNFKIKTIPENQVIWRMHQNTPRLTDSNKMAEGIFQFTHKYSRLMNKKQRFYNLQKIYGHQYKSGKKIAFLKYLIVSILLKLLKLITLNPKI
jgi:glycosyltransferase involved in cell wall biosynthesis